MDKIFFNKEAEKQYQKIPKSIISRVRRSILNLAKNPYAGKKLQGKLAGNYSVRAWPYRIIYQIAKKSNIVIIVSILHRQRAYK